MVLFMEFKANCLTLTMYLYTVEGVRLNLILVNQMPQKDMFCIVILTILILTCVVLVTKLMVSIKLLLLFFVQHLHS